MVQQLSLAHEGISHTAEYEVCGDTLTVYLPNGETRTTELRGLDAELAAVPHLQSYIKSLPQKDIKPKN